ncbi:MAG: TIR domain-containing protein [Anaerolineae bacterium]|nr:TIR domain-containing protein [Anaerolineae bacterium]
MSTKPHVFISYARSDGRDEAENLYRALHERHISAWYDRRNIEAGQDFSAEIEDGIEKATHVAVCVTPGSKRDTSFVRNEIQYARLVNKPIIPLRFENIAPHVTISTYSYIDFFGREWTDAVKELLDWLDKPLSDHPESPAPKEIDPFRKHVEQLSHFTVRILKQTVFNAQVVMLRSQDSPDAIAHETLPTIYQTQHPTWFSGDEKPAEFKTFAEAFTHHEQRVLLLGAPGAGKTTSLLAFARDCAYARLEDSKALLPVYAPITRWDGSTLLVEWLAKEANLPVEALRTEIEAGHALLLLDGLDELPDEVADPSKPMSRPRDYRVDFMHVLAMIPKTPTLITCRIKDYDNIVKKGGEKIALNGAVTLKPLTDEQIKTHLNNQPELWAAIEADDRLREMARTPLLLTLLTVAYRDAGSKARELKGVKDSADLQDKIFETYVHQRYQFEQRRSPKPLPLTLEQIYALMGQVTIAMFGDPDRMTAFRSRKGQVEITLALPRRVLGDEQAEIFLELAQRLHLLVQFREDAFRFVHLLLRDHFAVSYCLSRLIDTQLEDELRIAAALTLGEIGSSVVADALVAILQNDNEKQEMHLLSAWMLGRIGDKRAIESLLEFIESDDKEIQSVGLLGLCFGEIDFTNYVQLVQPLIGYLDKDNDASIGAALVLGRVGQKAFKVLVDFLHSNASDEGKIYAALALGMMQKTAKQIQELEVVFHDLQIPTEVLKNLDELNSDKLSERISDLTAYIGTNTIHGGYAAGVLLGNSSDQLIQGAIGALKSSFPGVRKSAVSMFMFNPDARVVIPLIERLNDEIVDIRKNAAFVLGEIGDYRAVQPLISLLNDPDKEVRKEARAALRKLGYDPATE